MSQGEKLYVLALSQGLMKAVDKIVELTGKEHLECLQELTGLSNSVALTFLDEYGSDTECE